MEKARGFRFVISFLVLGLLFSLLSSFKIQSRTHLSLPIYHIANAAYREGKFEQALRGFARALSKNPDLPRVDPLLNFKMGYALFKTGDWDAALQKLIQSEKELDLLQDYLLYFQAVSLLRKGDTLSAGKKLHRLLTKFRQSPLLPLVDSLQVEVFSAAGQPDSTLKYELRMLHSGRFEKTEIYLNIIRLEKNRADTAAFRKYAFRFLKNYPFHNRADGLFKELRATYRAKIPTGEFKKLLGFLFQTKQFLASEDLVANQAKHAASGDERDYFNWLPVEIAYRQGEYRRVLNWCRQQRRHFTSFKILRKIDLYTARCYSRLGRVDEAIQAYLDFQKKYPTDALAAEVLWKVAWLYEDQQKISRAIATYKKLVRTYRRASFRSEAAFRIGLDYYRMAKYTRARQEWQEALNKTNDRFQQSRLRYWIGKSYERQGKLTEQGKIFLELARRPVDSFYNLKAFYLTSDGSETHRSIRRILWQLHHREQSFLPENIFRFRRALQVEEILGKRWSKWELKTLRPDVRNWEQVFALGEMYERMHDYGQAFRKFRAVFNRHFFDRNLPDMIPVFKKLYPFYFTEHIDSATGEFPVDPALVLAVIKKESAFEPHIISYANAYGLMQLLPGTASQIAPKLKMRFRNTGMLFDPQINIRMGNYYLFSLLKRYQGNKVMALAAYNAGPHRVDRWKKNFPTTDDDLFMENLAFEQTRGYVRTCLKYYWLYKAILNPEQIPEEILHYPVRFTRDVLTNPPSAENRKGT